MKSYNDQKLLIGLLFLGIAGGFAGRFLEAQHISFPASNNLNQAAAILATQENIVGLSTPEAEPTISLGLGTSAGTDVSFSRTKDCGETMAIKAVKKRTVGFLCLSTTDKHAAATIARASTHVNALVVAFKGTDEATARQSLGLGASVVTLNDANTVRVYTVEKSARGSTFTLDLTGKTASNLAVVKK